MTKQLITDKYVKLEKAERLIKDNSSSVEEREENWQTVDEIVNYKFVESVLDRLPEEHHGGFLEIYTKSPNDETVVFGFLEEKVGKDIKDDLKKELEKISSEMLDGFLSNDETTLETQSEGKPPVK
jgi:hypothetical protein